jgi:hypothetical protein
MEMETRVVEEEVEMYCCTCARWAATDDAFMCGIPFGICRKDPANELSWTVTGEDAVCEHEPSLWVPAEV